MDAPHQARESGRTALILGATGQDGALLARHLLGLGYDVIGTTRGTDVPGTANLARLGIGDRVRLMSPNILDTDSVLELLERTLPDEVYHLAGQSSVGVSFEQPAPTLESIVFSTMSALEAIRLTTLPIRYFSAGSSECFGSVSAPATEDTCFRPCSPYAVAKTAAYWQVANYREAYGLFACTGILFNHESPLRNERFVTKKIVNAARRIRDGARERLKLGNIDVARDWGWAPDYVQAMSAMMHQDEPEDFVIATGRTVTLRDFVRFTFDQCGLDWADYVDENPSLIRPTEIMTSLANPSKARLQLSWTASRDVEGVVAGMLSDEL